MRTSFAIDGAVEIDPEDTRDERQSGNEWQKQNERREDAPLPTPGGERPEQRDEQAERRQRERVADVHGAHEVARLALVLQPADRAVRMHARQAAKHGSLENRALTAARAQATEDGVDG